MKHILLILTVIFALALPDFADAQKVASTQGVAYSTSNPTTAPISGRPHQLWLNTETGILFAWDKSARAWYR